MWTLFTAEDAESAEGCLSKCLASDWTDGADWVGVWALGGVSVPTANRGNEGIR